jgi:hypothetical protein
MHGARSCREKREIEIRNKGVEFGQAEATGWSTVCGIQLGLSISEYDEQRDKSLEHREIFAPHFGSTDGKHRSSVASFHALQSVARHGKKPVDRFPVQSIFVGVSFFSWIANQHGNAQSFREMGLAGWITVADCFYNK